MQHLLEKTGGRNFESYSNVLINITDPYPMGTGGSLPRGKAAGA
jgi:hypothetical protein